MRAPRCVDIADVEQSRLCPSGPSSTSGLSLMHDRLEAVAKEAAFGGFSSGRGRGRGGGGGSRFGGRDVRQSGGGGFGGSGGGFGGGRGGARDSSVERADSGVGMGGGGSFGARPPMGAPGGYGGSAVGGSRQQSWVRRSLLERSLTSHALVIARRFDRHRSPVSVPRIRIITTSVSPVWPSELRAASFPAGRRPMRPSSRPHRPHPHRSPPSSTQLVHHSHSIPRFLTRRARGCCT